MKSILKLMFGVTLVGWAIGMPAIMRAAEPTYYNCNYPELSACVNQINSYMNQCTTDCGDSENGGAGGTLCGTTTTMMCDPQTPKCTKITGQECVTVPDTAMSCVNGCLDQLQMQEDNCASYYCTPGPVS